MIAFTICFAIFALILFEWCIPSICSAWRERNYIKIVLFIFLIFLDILMFSTVRLWLHP